VAEYEFRVRWYQQNFHKALTQRTHDRLMAVWHRRAGKDEIVLNAFRELALKRPATYWHCFPEYKQARKAIWLGVNSNTGRRRIDEAFPPEIRRRMLDDDMFIEFTNGATWQLLGSDRYDATVGAGPAGIAYSEWALCNPSAWAYHSPMIRESNGFAAFITTPRGNNHAKAMADRAAQSPDWFYERLTIDDTQALSPVVLAEALREYQDLHGEEMGLAFYEQEYMCSWSGAMVGAYWGAEVNRAEREGRVAEFEIDWSHPVHTAWDLGKAVNNPIWCFQVIAGQPRIVDFYQPESDDLADWVKWLNDRGYTGIDYVPHDIVATEWGSKRTRFELLQSTGRKPRRLPQVAVADGLQAGRVTINAARFRDTDRVRSGLEGLKNYRREWDDERKTFREVPVKDWAEHIGSAFRYLGLAWKDVVPPVEKIRKPTELVYEVEADGTIRGNMSVRDAVDAMVKRRKARR
jgi:phage terminase large subunit